MTTYTRSVEGLWNAGSKERGAAIVAAIARGDWQIDGDLLYIIDERNAIDVATRGKNRGPGFEFAPNSTEFSFDFGGIEYFIIATPDGAGRHDLVVEYQRRDDLMDEMRREAGRDPEGAFGGRGNNLILGM